MTFRRDTMEFYVAFDFHFPSLYRNKGAKPFNGIPVMMGRYTGLQNANLRNAGPTMNATRVALAVLIAAVSLDCAAADCSAQKAFLCTDAGCEAVGHDFFIVLDDSKPAVLRCDKNGCDQIDVQTLVSGVMKTYAAPGRGYLLRLNSVDRSFVEIAIQMTNVLLKYGVCIE